MFLMKKPKNALTYMGYTGNTIKWQNATNTLIKFILFNFLNLFLVLLTAILYWERKQLGKDIE